MNPPTPLHRVLDALQQIVAHPQHQPALIAEFFSADYRQRVDGHTLDYAQFVRHMALLKQQTRSMALEVIAAAAQGDAVLTHHRVRVEKRDGTRSLVRVLAHFTVRDGRIRACDELTELLEGAHGDRDLGSRVSD
ncbi:nuclear transport factor 2 family protein [Serratia ficaria]|uniref:SnoaL-like domain n=1 Tax=Serratia ficaria TaxID=61651 RepID=A0A240B4P9_SERFI|nr:nuclear transport factor 2 family protein [Serratia ficaria]REF46123.1 SnoaL-like protein [Serratia ficaria]CAI0865660.1 SnoaL-like domain [Serratia ficaria]CAI1007948.1 SnoaL-like domain [Serratia ficaria]CAI1021387.1 SnoaL-like domain [Serratia ficaria]CAI2054333.1 SnoaL-like domain [Serratia ficaria]